MTKYASGSRRRVVVLCCAALLGACGGGGGSAPEPVDPGPVQPGPITGTVRWLSSAANLELHGTSDSGIDGPLVAVNPKDPTATRRFDPSPVDSTVVRITGGTVDATQSTLSEASVRHLVWDSVDASGAVTLHKLSLDANGSAVPAPERLSTENRICIVDGVRFEVAGQSLSGDEAVVVYAAPDVNGSCDPAVTRPRLVKLSMGASSAPIELPAAAAERITPIAPIHGSVGQIAGFLAWQDGRFVRTDPTLRSPVPLDAANLGGPVTADSVPRGPGFVTRYGIFIRSNDGLRRYDKSVDALSAVLVTGQVGEGTAVGQVADDRALYVSSADAQGRIDLYRVEDLRVPVVDRLNVEGPLKPSGFRVLKSSVLYALEGRDDWTAWNKSDGTRSRVFAGRNVVLASSLHDRVFTKSLASDGSVVLSQSLPDGSGERVFGGIEVLSAGLADQVSPYARHLRMNASYSHALLVIPGAAGAGEARWVSFDAPASDVVAGQLPAGLSLDVQPDWQSPGIVGAQSLIGVRRAGSSARYLFVAGRAPGALVRAADGLQ
jgi:hypothetical protein